MCCQRPSAHTSTESQQKELINDIIDTLPDEVWVIFQAADQAYWFGTNGQGVYRQVDEIITQYTTDDGLVSNAIRGIQQDNQGRIYIETPAGVSQYDGHTFKTIEPILSKQNNWALSANDLWFNCNGDANDIYRYDGSTLHQLRLPRQDLLTAFGIDTTNQRFDPYTVFGIDKDSQGNLWIGTAAAGAFRYDGEKFLWINEQELSVLPDDRVPGVRSMLQDVDGYLWLSNFLKKYEILEMGSITFYHTSEGLARSVPYFIERLPYFGAGIIDQQGHLWMTTYSGAVYQYDGANLQEHQVEVNGTMAAILTIYQDRQQQIFLGTQKLGILRWTGLGFDPYKL